jgi:hypothetical protein
MYMFPSLLSGGCDALYMSSRRQSHNKGAVLNDFKNGTGKTKLER